MSKSRNGILNVGVIGTGFGAAVHIPGFNLYPRTQVVALCGRDWDKTSAIAARENIPIVCRHFEELVQRDDIDIISIATPNNLNKAIVLMAAQYGKHILCEKPLAVTLDEAKEMCDVVCSKPITHGLDHLWRYNPQRWTIRKLIQDGAIGQVYAVNVWCYGDFLLHPPSWNWMARQDLGGGTLSAMGSHLVDTLLWWFGDLSQVFCLLDVCLPQRLDVKNRQLRPVEADDMFSMVGQLAGGGQVVAQYCMASNDPCPFNRQFEIRGSNGTLVLESNGRLLYRGVDSAELNVPLVYPPQLSFAVDVASVHRLLPPFLALLHSFVNSIENNSPFAPNFIDGVRTQSVIEAMRISHQSKQSIDPRSLL